MSYVHRSHLELLPVHRSSTPWELFLFASLDMSQFCFFLFIIRRFLQIKLILRAFTKTFFTVLFQREGIRIWFSVCSDYLRGVAFIVVTTGFFWTGVLQDD